MLILLTPFLNLCTAATIVTLVARTAASPLYAEQSHLLLQSSFSKDGEYKYENGEIPPTNDTVGWIDPRLNGGRLLDVCICGIDTI